MISRKVQVGIPLITASLVAAVVVAVVAAVAVVLVVVVVVVVFGAAGAAIEATAGVVVAEAGIGESEEYVIVGWFGIGVEEVEEMNTGIGVVGAE